MSLIKLLKSKICCVSWLGFICIAAILSPQVCADVVPTEELTFEPGYIQLNVKNLHIDPFFEVLITPTNEIYLPVSKVLQKLELKNFVLDWQNKYISGLIPLTNIYCIFDLSSGIVRNDTVEATLLSSQYLIKDGEVYLHTDAWSKWLPLTVVWDAFIYEVAIYPEFKLISEIFREREEARKKILGEPEVPAKDVLKKAPQIFEPGMFYAQAGIGGGLKGLSGPEVSLSYAGPFLYGDFLGGIGFSLTSGVELKAFQLKYRDIWKFKELIIGANLLEVPTLLGYPAVIQGVSYRNIDDGYKYGVTRVGGFAPPDSDVELFYLGMLIDYQTVKNGMYLFENIPLRGAFNVYEVVIYTPDGQILRERHAVVSEAQQLAKDKYLIQGGLGVSDLGFIAVNKGYYGLNDDLTVGGNLIVLPKNDGSNAVQGYLGLEGVYKPSQSSFLYAESELGLGPLGAAFKVGAESVSRNWILRSQLLGYAGLDVPQREKVMLENRRLQMSQQFLLEGETSFARQNLAVNYKLANFQGKLRHSFEARYSYQLNFRTFLRLDNSFSIGPGAGWNNRLHGNLSYSGWSLMDLSFDGQLLLRNGGQGFYRFYLDFVNKRKQGMPLSYAAGLYLSEGQVGLSGSVQYQIVDWMSVKASVGTDVLDVSLNLSDSRRVIPPFKQIKRENFGLGWVEGYVYVDENGNGTKEENELFFPGVEILVNGRPGGTTDSTGYYMIEGLRPYQPIKLEINTTTLDALYLPVKDSVWLEVNRGSGLQLDLGVVPCSGVSGQIDGLILATRPVLVLTTAEGVEVLRTNPEMDGFFVIEKIQPGSYLLKIELPESEQGHTLTPVSYQIEVPYGEMPKWYDDIIFWIK